MALANPNSAASNTVTTTVAIGIIGAYVLAAYARWLSLFPVRQLPDSGPFSLVVHGCAPMVKAQGWPQQRPSIVQSRTT